MTLQVIEGDCLAVLPTLATRFHAVVTDPPYELSFMGRKWDSTGVAFRPETWRAIHDVMLPGGYLVAFASTRGYHRMVCAIEDAGFVIHPMLAWIFGSGFPKAADVSKAIDRQLGAVREVVGPGPWNSVKGMLGRVGGITPEGYVSHGGTQHDITAPATPEAQQWDGWKYGLQSLKPAIEPICLAQKPPERGGMVGNILRHGTGALNIDASRVGTEQTVTLRNGDSGGNGAYGRDERVGSWINPPGRYPANVITDGSPEVLDAFAAFGSGTSYEWGEVGRTSIDHRDTGTAARFYYSAKADAADRADSRHPTVKPVDLIRYLVRLVTTPGGRVLDPFAGSGTTGEACMLLGHDCTLIERDPTHAADIRHRIKRWSGLDAPLFADAAN